MRIALLLLVVACNKVEPRDPPPRPDPMPVPIPTHPPTSVDNDRWLLLEQHANTATTASYLAIELATDPKAAPKLDALGTRPALAMANWPGHYRTVAAHRADRWAYVENKRVVVAFASSVSGGKSTRSFAVPFEPAALHLAGEALYVGGPQSVGWIDLSAATPAYVELAKRDQQFKAYDRFVRLGDRLVAIDDEVMPMYADWFALDGAGRPTKRLGDWSLPGVINGHYDHAALLATAANEWTLYLVAPYGILSGDGFVLAAIPVRDDKLVFDKSLTLQNRDGKTPIVREHSDRGSGRPAQLLAGTTPTGWSGLALARTANRIVIAANARGLMVLPADFAPTTTTATLVDLGGDVRDVRDQGGHLFALVVTATATELVVLDPTIKPIARHALPGPFVRFVD